LANEKAEAIYEKRYDELAHEYQIYKRDLQAIIDRNKDKIQEQEAELKSLQETRAAAITAAQQEKHIQENKDYYCLILPIEEASDVNILRGVAKRISKPRSILMAIWQAYYQPIAKKKFPQILGKPDVCGIYKITNQETGECYIGQAIDVRRR
jgi:alanyl-tRNA synthetase